jgi:RNA polymerase sigma-70 factor (ECF subfamily)
MAPLNADKLREADPEALAVLVDELLPRLLRAATFYTRDSSSAEDIFMEVFHKLLRDPLKLAELASTGALEKWCMHLTRNVAVHHARRVKREATYAATESPEEQPDESTTVSPAMQNQILAALDSLDEATRLVITLRYLDGLSVREIAGKLSISPATVRVRTYRAIRQLRQRVWDDATTGPGQ